MTGLTTAQMHAQASFTPAGTAVGQWNFTPNTGTWVIFEGQSNPLLRALMTQLTVTANNATKTYDGLAYNGGAGVTYSVTPNANLLGTVSYTGGINAGSYTLTPGGLTSAPVQQGYLITYVGGTLTVNPVPSGGISPVVAQAITALPGGANLLPAFSAAVTSAATPVLSPVVVAMNVLPGLSSAAAPATQQNSDMAADSNGATDNQETIQARQVSVNLQADSFRIEPGSNVTIVNGGIRLPDDMRMSLHGDNEFNFKERDK